MDDDAAQQRLKWAEALFNAGGRGNLELAVQDMKLLVREALTAWARAGGAPLEVSAEGRKLLDGLDELARSAATAQQFFEVQAGVESFLRRAP